MKNSNQDIFDDIKEVIRESLIDALSQVVLIYYHNYKKDEDSYEQIFSSLLDFVIMIENDSKILHQSVVENLEKKYFYKIEGYQPLKLKSTI